MPDWIPWRPAAPSRPGRGERDAGSKAVDRGARAWAEDKAGVIVAELASPRLAGAAGRSRSTRSRWPLAPGRRPAPPRPNCGASTVVTVRDSPSTTTVSPARMPASRRRPNHRIRPVPAPRAAPTAGQGDLDFRRAGRHRRRQSRAHRGPAYRATVARCEPMTMGLPASKPVNARHFNVRGPGRGGRRQRRRGSGRSHLRHRNGLSAEVEPKAGAWPRRSHLDVLAPAGAAS